MKIKEWNVVTKWLVNNIHNKFIEGKNIFSCITGLFKPNISTQYAILFR